MATQDTRQRVLIIDDTPENIEVLRQLLRGDYVVQAAINGKKGLEIAQALPQPDIILLDIMMPEMDGYEVCRRLKGLPATEHIPVVFITALDQTGHETTGLELGAVDYIRKPFEPLVVKARVHNHLRLKRYEQELEALVQERTAELALTQQVTIEALASLAEYRDSETGGHIKRTQHYMRALATHLGQHGPYRAQLDPQTIELLFRCAPLHDIGKVAVPDSILLKPGKLTAEEFEQMKRHVEYGANALDVAKGQLGSSHFLHLARELILGHHERWDGKGYPNRLAGEDIPLAGRLMALADVYDALICKRVYKDAFSHAEAAQIIIDGRGTQFDPVIVDAFAELAEQFEAIAHTYSAPPPAPLLNVCRALSLSAGRPQRPLAAARSPGCAG
ncbi:putative cyclic di-GMP phosphodiesterase VC_1348 [Thauera humireducens]|uniref:response regulator n=1 Tax=Thauera humireducens TaxID=1134435 RepID=UPI002467A336|nr:two-component system response regulator [Thauera humireducens]CAH1746289.1 putative cyclic di-GMP phosphodiesterase VC_1348 [Thauera humireducens]